ncbi:MAG: Copper-exporting P-type ATPase B [Methanocella sp. PtaU1.Bin125]|nr:MAG: Copper-exporting P-type ATPase B [Methanocella sp. PtaU1.Bin125]
MLGSGEKGLGASEAANRLATYGPNELKRKPPRSVLAIFIGQFQNFLIYILIAATAISLLIGETVDAAIIAAIVVLNAMLGTYQEYQAEQSLESLQRYQVREAYVLRDGHKVRVKASELVPGDVIELEAGDSIPADARIIWSAQFSVDESALTGESEADAKVPATLPENTAAGDMENMIFAATTAIDGRCGALVVRTGMSTEIGRIAGLVESGVKRETPVQISINKASIAFGLVAIATCGLIFVFGIAEGKALFDMFLIAVSLAVAAIPEGLPATITIIFALGVQRMAGQKAIVRKLAAVETLGSTDVICSDKTGTLTQNVIVVRRIVTLAGAYDVTGIGYTGEGGFAVAGQKVDPGRDAGLRQLLLAGVLCNNASYEKLGDSLIITGDSTEVALLVAGAKAGMYKVLTEDRCPRQFEVPFSAETRRMLTVNKCDDGTVALVKGAPEVILGMCSGVQADGQVRALDAETKAGFLRENDAMAGHGMRVLAFAEKPAAGPLPGSMDELMSGMTFLGLAGMIDPPRSEARDSVARCHSAGINVLMITGDQAPTALSIARDVGIADDGDEVITGAGLNAMTDAQLDERIERIRVYARASPEQKLRIVNAMQRKDHVVAMTGDGVNDAPALKYADIGVSMGINGTDVARQASDMVLADDNFATIVRAVEEGRNIYDNVRKAIKFLFSGNIGEVLAIFIGIMLNLPLPLIAIQILWVNLITDSLPSLALGMDPPERGLMKRKPRRRSEGIINRMMLLDMALIGGVIGVGTLGIFYLMLPAGEEYARTMAFSALVIFQMWNVINCKAGEKSAFSTATFNNLYAWGAIVVSVAMLAAILYIPFTQPLFSVVPLSLNDWGLLVVWTVPVLVVVELRKAIVSLLSKNRDAGR